MKEFTYVSSQVGPSIIRMEGLAVGDHVFQQIQATEGFYEQDLLEYLERRFRGLERGVVIDVGANIGNHAVFFGKYIASHVIAIEPNRAVLPVLERNLRNNIEDPSLWSIVGSAVGTTDGVGVIEVPDGAGANVGMARIRQSPAGTDRGERIAVTTVDQVVSAYHEGVRGGRAVRLIKIDVEGMEVEVLKGAADVIERFGPDLAVEAPTPSEKQRIDDVLGPLGYVAVARYCATPTYHYVRHPSPRVLFTGRLRQSVGQLRRFMVGIIRVLSG